MIPAFPDGTTLLRRTGWTGSGPKPIPVGELLPQIGSSMKSEPGPPMTLGTAVAAGVRLIVWCKACQHQVEPDPVEIAARYGAETPVLDWRERVSVAAIPPCDK